jgi:hypothetical protein
MTIVDAISSAISSARAGRANGRRLRASGTWGMRFPGFVGIGFHFLLHGEAWLIADGSMPVRLRPGDVVIAPNGAAHGLGHAPAQLSEWPEFPRTDLPMSRADAEFLCGAYRLDHGRLHPMLRRLPRTIVVSPDHAHSPELRTLVSLLENEVSEVQQGNWVTRSALVDLVLVHALRGDGFSFAEDLDGGGPYLEPRRRSLVSRSSLRRSWIGIRKGGQPMRELPVEHL